MMIFLFFGIKVAVLRILFIRFVVILRQSVGLPQRW